VSSIPDHVASRRGLLISATASGLAFIAQLAVAFILAPMMLRYLGRERYGVWSFVESFLAYFTLFDLGVSATLVRYVPRCRATGDLGMLNRIVSGCLLIFSGAGLLVFTLGLGLFAIVIKVTGKVPTGLHAEVWDMAVVSVVAMALNLPLTIFPAVLDGLGRFSLKAVIRTVFLGIRFAGVLWVMKSGGNLIHLAFCFAATTVFEQLAMGYAVHHFLPELKPAPWRTNREALRLVRGYSFDSFLAMLAGRIAFKTDAIVIGLCGQLDLIPFFDMPARLVEYAKNLIRSATTTLTPAFSTLEAKGSKAAIRDLFVSGCRYALYLALPIHIALILFGGAFLELWLGDPEYRVRGEPILWILAGTLSVGMLQSVAARVLYGIGQIRRFARLMLLEAFLNLSLSVILFPVFGLNGVALGTAIPNICMCLYIVIQVSVMLEVTDRQIFRRSLLCPLVANAGLAALWHYLYGTAAPMSEFTFRDLIANGSRLAFVELIAAGVFAYAVVTALLEYGLLIISRRETRALPETTVLKIESPSETKAAA
jgi:O-antigen/teichoic acid export membrane protein